MNKVADNLLASLGGRAYNFSPGPAAIPKAVLEQAQDELLNWQGQGASVMEVSHRGKAFIALAEESEKNLRQLMSIPNNYRVLFLQGGARGQFAAVPMNLKDGYSSADYVHSGFWAKTAIAEAKRYLNVETVASGEDNNFLDMPDQDTWQRNPDAAYLHYTPNETIGGLEFPWVPNSGSVPLVADMSSSILSCPVDVSRFGVIYAGAQKNIGPAGLTLVIIRDDLLNRESHFCPSVFHYKSQVARESMYSTPPTFAWYMANLVFRWLKAQGGLEVMHKVNSRKAAKLYGMIDKTGFYQNSVSKAWRSKMNVPFTLKKPELDSTFLAEAEQEGFLYLKGHKAAGGMRASIYNAVSEQQVDALVSFMAEFERRYG
ncbi:MAG: 3-phosphoserine/phosphohydroxythreonine transaminase [Endozoicomonas sp. (ex Botrylloides leachii)]|nr:3-phosphoserine/phosphohydroxythreonine transaminase [Endozoicomonas sp. (ex Botrylloides leachii)]